MSLHKLYNTELWKECLMLYIHIKKLVKDNQNKDDVILKKDLVECSFYIKENLIVGFINGIDMIYIQNALGFVTGLEKSLEMAKAKFFLTYKEFYGFMQRTNDIKALFKDLMRTCNPPMK